MGSSLMPFKFQVKRNALLQVQIQTQREACSLTLPQHTTLKATGLKSMSKGICLHYCMLSHTQMELFHSIPTPYTPLL